jgi:hypothetical protein
MKTEGLSPKKFETYNLTPCDVIFNHIEKPENYLYCRSINIYDDRWRVNLYSKRMIDGIEGKHISNSYFTHFNSATGNLAIVSS